VDGDPTLLAGSLGASRDRVADDLLVDSPSDLVEYSRVQPTPQSHLWVLPRKRRGASPAAHLDADPLGIPRCERSKYVRRQVAGS
jgi:hypothetical protein